MSDEVPNPDPKPTEPALQAEAEAAPESAWFFAWFKSAMLYLATVTAYLGAVTGLVAAWKNFIAGEGDQADLTTYILAGILALPLLFAFLFNLLPALRRRRERHLRPVGKGAEDYFDTAPRDDDPHGFFREGYTPFLDWARNPRAPLLHLTGLSGSGKSSLLSAFLRPRLAEAGTRLLIVRSYHDPLAALKDELLTLWKEEPKDYGKLTPLDALRRAAGQLGKNERLLIAFDQFEEFFLLRAANPEKTDGSADAPVVAESAIAPLRDFLRAFIDDRPERIALLLSYREDHRRLLVPLDLAAREERRNWMTVDPLDFAAAGAFLRSCPGLAVPDDRMQRVLREAARQEGGRVVMRPIVANLLGLILRQMSGHPILWRRSGDLLRGYVRDCLGTELHEERGRILRALLTDFHTARPRPAADIAREARIDAATLETHLDHFSRAGLVRCVNRDEPSAARRIWQIAHDFLATLTERVLDGLHRTLWRTLRPWLAPAAIGLVLLLGVIWPWVAKHRAISFLANAGFTWNEEKAEIKAATNEARSFERLDPLVPAFHRLHPQHLDLSGNFYGFSALQNVDGLKGFTFLKSLNLSSCGALQNFDVLKGLISLQNLDLSFCEDLQNVDVLKGLTSLKSLNLTYCKALQNFDGLKGMTSLQSLGLSHCDALQNVDALTGLTSLQSLDLSQCDGLQNVDALTGLTSLQSLDLSQCDALQDIDALTGLTSLQSLDLSQCDALQNIDALTGLTSLQSLDLSQCDALQNIDALTGLTSLQSLDLSQCDALQKVDVLKGLTSLQHLDLSSCKALQNVDGLKGLTSLQRLDLSYCDAIQNVDVLKGLTSLQHLDLNSCKALQNVDGLKGLTSLQRLDLRDCKALPKENWEALTAALPKTFIMFPDGATAGPPEKKYFRMF